MNNIDTTPYDGETIVAYWRIARGRIIAALFRDGDNYRYRTDNGGGYLSIPLVDLKLGNGDHAAIGAVNRKIHYRTARWFWGAPIHHVIN